MSDDFTFDTPTAPNPVLAKATVTHRSDRTKEASTKPLQANDEGAMPPPRPRKIPLEKGYSQMDWMRLQRSGKDLTGLGGKALRRDVTLEEVKLHSTLDDAWTVLRGRVYNITAYLKFHPGGVQQLMRGAGKDCTQLFVKYHAWVNAEMMLEKCCIGLLAKPPSQEPVA